MCKEDNPLIGRLFKIILSKWIAHIDYIIETKLLGELNKLRNEMMELRGDYE